MYFEVLKALQILILLLKTMLISASLSGQNKPEWGVKSSNRLETTRVNDDRFLIFEWPAPLR